MAEPPLDRFRQFLAELRRRNVYKVAVTYLTVAFVGFQAAQLLIPVTVLPGWSDEFFLFFLIVGFPVALVVAWAFEMTPQGVRRTSDVDAAAPGPPDPGGEPPGTDRTGTTPAASTAEAAPKTGYRILLALGLGAAAVAGGWYLMGGSGDAPRAGQNSIAVLPFEELGQEEPGAFTEGMHEAVLTRLSNVSGLTVTAGRAVRRYRETDMNTAEIARELGVKWILTGSVQQAESRIQVSAQLVDPRGGTNAWAENYPPRELTAENIFAIQEEITRKIVDSLQTQLTPEEAERIGRRPTEDLDAYRLYLRGRPLLDQRTEGEIRSALEYFEQAIARDSSYALAWSGLADARSLLWFYDYSPADSVAGQALRAARRAVELAPDLGEAHTSLGIVQSLRQRGPSALEQLQRAVELKPSHPEAHIWLSWVNVMIGRPERALGPGRRAVEIDPVGPAYRVYLAEALLANGRDEEALQHARRAQDLRPDYGLGHFITGLALHHLGRYSSARAAWDSTRVLVPPQGAPTHDEIRAASAAALAASGDTAGARSMLSRIDRDRAPFSRALAHAALGQVDSAFAAAAGIEHWGSFTNEHIRYYFPETLARFRSDPRYARLLRRLNRAWGLEPDGSLPGPGG